MPPPGTAHSTCQSSRETAGPHSMDINLCVLIQKCLCQEPSVSGMGVGVGRGGEVDTGGRKVCGKTSQTLPSSHGKGWDVAQLAECLLKTYEALSQQHKINRVPAQPGLCEIRSQGEGGEGSMAGQAYFRRCRRPLCMPNSIQASC